MQSAGTESRAWSVLTLHRTRGLLLGLRYRLLVGVVALAYAFGAMVFGGMLYFPPHPLTTGWLFYIYPTGPGPSWAYPILLVEGPYFQLGLPFISAILVTLSAAGVGLGMSAAVFLSAGLIRDRGRASVLPTSLGTAVGLTPVMIALVTLGACCSTTAAATAGIALAAQSSGTTPAAALANGWYLGIFQAAVIYVALVAQEQLLIVFGFFSRSPGGSSGLESRGAEVPLRRGMGVASALLRLALVGAGLTWSLSMLTAWFTLSPEHASVATWVGWIGQHQVPGVLAVLVGLFPAATLRFWTHLSSRVPRAALRALLIGCGLSLLLWVPPPLSGLGVAGLGNELLGFWGFPSSWGAVAPPALGIVGLSLRWAFQLALLGLVTLSMGISPEATVRPMVLASGLPRTAPSSPVSSAPRVPSLLEHG